MLIWSYSCAVPCMSPERTDQVIAISEGSLSSSFSSDITCPDARGSSVDGNQKSLHIKVKRKK
jgi:hypothetical protein